MRISDWSSDVCSSDLPARDRRPEVCVQLSWGPQNNRFSLLLPERRAPSGRIAGKQVRLQAWTIGFMELLQLDNKQTIKSRWRAGYAPIHYTLAQCGHHTTEPIERYRYTGGCPQGASHGRTTR